MFRRRGQPPATSEPPVEPAAAPPPDATATAVAEAAAAAQATAETADRKEGLVLAVSVMAPWKGIDVVVEALALLRHNGVSARLRLVGPWPDRAYEAMIRQKLLSFAQGAMAGEQQESPTAAGFHDRQHRRQQRGRIVGRSRVR